MSCKGSYIFFYFFFLHILQIVWFWWYKYLTPRDILVTTAWKQIKVFQSILMFRKCLWGPDCVVWILGRKIKRIQSLLSSDLQSSGMILIDMWLIEYSEKSEWSVNWYLLAKVLENRSPSKYSGCSVFIKLHE